jgi:hypothetical protein
MENMAAKSITILISGVLATVLITDLARAEETEYTSERYNLILDRSPFGSDPLLDTGTPGQQSAAATAAAAKELRLCFLLETEGGEIRAGFQKLKAKPGDPKSVILMVGESFMGMKLLEIDLGTSQATLESQGEPVTFELSRAPTPAAKAAPKKATANPATPQRRFGGGFRRKEPPPESAKPKPIPEPKPQLSPEEEQRRREEVRKNLQDYQMEVIRQGMPPLPIPLTQEMDDQLVAEGVLPPAAPE